MQTLRSLLLSFFIALQAMAPLLHAHVGDAPGNGNGLHLAGLPSGAMASSGLPAAAQWESPVVDLCDQFRRQALAVPALPPSSHPFDAQAARRDGLLWILSLAPALPERQPVFARPSSHAPPVIAA